MKTTNLYQKYRTSYIPSVKAQHVWKTPGKKRKFFFITIVYKKKCFLIYSNKLKKQKKKMFFKLYKDNITRAISITRTVFRLNTNQGHTYED